MKKKIALLLVLTMIVSLIPMNVFGATRFYVPDRDDVQNMPANVVDMLRIDLADLDPRADLNDGETYTNDNIPGYAIRISLTDDAVFGQDFDIDDSTYYFDRGNYVVSGDFVGVDDPEFENLIEFVNVQAGVWDDDGGNNVGPAQVYNMDLDTHEKMTNTEAKNEATAKNPYIPADKTSITSSSGVTATDGDGNPVVLNLSNTPLDLFKNSSSNVEMKNHDANFNNSGISIGSDIWDDFVGLMSGSNPVYPYNAPYPFVVTYTYEVVDENEIIMFIQLFDAVTGLRIDVPDDLDANDFYVEMALPIVVDDWDDQIELEDLTGDDDTPFENFPRRIVEDYERSMTVDVSQTASFASNGFLDVVTLNETAYGFLEQPNDDTARNSSNDSRVWEVSGISAWDHDNNSSTPDEATVTTSYRDYENGDVITETVWYDRLTAADRTLLNSHATVTSDWRRGSDDYTQRTRVVELRLDSDYAWLMENTRERLKFTDEHGTFHDDSGNSGRAYDYVDFFGPDDEFEDVDYNFTYEIGNRDRYINGEVNKDRETDFDIRFFFSGEGDLPGEGPTDKTNTKGDHGRSDGQTGSARYGSNVSRADELNIYNLMVGFDDRQQFDKEFELEYRAYDIDTELLEDGDDADDPDDRTYLLFDDSDDDSWEVAANIPVVRKQDVVMLDLLDDRLGAAIETPDTVVSGRFAEETTPFRISEVVNGTWDNAQTVMSVGDGVEITGAHVSVYEYDFDAYDTADRPADGNRVESTTWDANRNYGDDEYWTNDDESGNEDYDYVDITRHQNYFNNGGIRIDNKSITFDPRMTSLTTSGERREIEVQLELSIEAGYVSKGRNATNPNAIDMTFSGPGAANFESATFTVATVHDPITVSPVTPVTAAVDWEQKGYEQNIGDITVTENATGDLEQNKEIWLYVTGTTQTDLNLDAGKSPVVNTAESGLQLYGGTQLRHQFGNFWLSGVRYNVERESGLSNKNVPASITFEDVTISGAMYSNAEYAIVISGSAVAENDYTVWANNGNRVANPSSGDFNTWGDVNNQAGVFDNGEPYVIQAIDWANSTVSEPPTTQAPPVAEPEDDVQQPTVIAGRTPQEFSAYSYSQDETTGAMYNNYMMAAAANGVGFAGISPRAFAQFIGGETVYDDATRTATVTGMDQNGAAVTIQLTQGSSNAVINGQTVDIATYNEHPGYPVGSIMPFYASNQRMYLPIRFLCKAFGVPFNYNELTKSVTLQ